MSRLEFLPSAALAKDYIKRAMTSRPVTLLSPPLQGQACCLTYHRITEELPNGDFYGNLSLAVHVDSFEQQMEYVSKELKPVSINKLMDAIENQLDLSQMIAVSFDDGYLDNLTLALPILERYQVPVTIFVSTDFISGVTIPWWFELEHMLRTLPRVVVEWKGVEHSYDFERDTDREAAFLYLDSLMKTLSPQEQHAFLSGLSAQMPPEASFSVDFLSWSQLRELVNHPLITIGAHTRSHPVLRSLSINKARREITESKRIIEHELDRKVELFSYPFGSDREIGRREINLAERAGFRSAFTTRNGYIATETDQTCYELPRVNVDYRDRLVDFVWNISGYPGKFRLAA